MLSRVSTMLYDYRRSKGLTQKDMAKMLQTSQPAYSLWENGSFLPKTRSISKIAALLGVDSKVIVKMIVKERLERAEAEKKLNVESLTRLAMMPIVGGAMAGRPSESYPSASETVSDYIRGLPLSGFAVKVKGDSMQTSAAKSIGDGYLCICSSADGIPPSDLVGDVVCARLLGEEHLIKELVFFNGKYYLKSWNASYPMIEVENPEAQIEGVVEFVIAKF